MLLTARVGAAFTDPLLGWWIGRGQGAYARYVALAVPLLLARLCGAVSPACIGRGRIAGLVSRHADAGVSRLRHCHHRPSELGRGADPGAGLSARA
ncbi:hypothetical protein LP420_12125 [Massilia sp. B-10]|nr:hypothetical protein LP420_12125 [Massilia sp. B-10]